MTRSAVCAEAISDSDSSGQQAGKLATESDCPTPAYAQQQLLGVDALTYVLGVTKSGTEPGAGSAKKARVLSASMPPRNRHCPSRYSPPQQVLLLSHSCWQACRSVTFSQTSGPFEKVRASSVSWDPTFVQAAASVAGMEQRAYRAEARVLARVSTDLAETLLSPEDDCLRETAKVDLVPAITLGNLGMLVKLPRTVLAWACPSPAAAAAPADAPAPCLMLEAALIALGGSL